MRVSFLISTPSFPLLIFKSGLFPGLGVNCIEPGRCGASCSRVRIGAGGGPCVISGFVFSNSSAKASRSLSIVSCISFCS